MRFVVNSINKVKKLERCVVQKVKGPHGLRHAGEQGWEDVDVGWHHVVVSAARQNTRETAWR